MKRTTGICLMCIANLCLCVSFVYANSEEKPKLPSREETAIQLPTRDESVSAPMDGVALIMGVYSPFHDEMKGIYGSMFSWSIQYCLNMSRSVDLLASVGYMSKDGDPYFDTPTFSNPDLSSGKSPRIRIIPIELSIRQRIHLMKSPSGSTSRGLHAGVGINYIRATEQTYDDWAATGGDFGAHIFAGPQIFFTERIAFEGEVKLMLNSVDMKYEDRRYSVTLSGLLIKAGVTWYY